MPMPGAPFGGAFSARPANQPAAVRPLNTVFQVSPTRGALVTYSVQITVSSTITGGQNGDVVLEIASNAGFTADVQQLCICGNGHTYGLAVALSDINPSTNPLFGYVPPGYYARLRTVANTGAPTFLYRTGQEVLL